MVAMNPIHGFRSLAHPLAQIRAAEEFYATVDAFVVDTWRELYVDEPPDEDHVADAVAPSNMIDALASLGLRFEVAAPMAEERVDDGFWAMRFGGGSLDALLYAWAYQVMEFVELDRRAFFDGLRWTDLIFVPDGDGLSAQAYQLLLTANSDAIRTNEAKHELFDRDHYRSDRGASRRKVTRGGGPRIKRPAVIDRATIAMRNAKREFTPEELAKHMRYKNLASLTAALHQVVSYGRPKRLLGWVVKTDGGRYRVTDETADKE